MISTMSGIIVPGSLATTCLHSYYNAEADPIVISADYVKGKKSMKACLDMMYWSDSQGADGNKKLTSAQGMTPRILYLGYARKWELFLISYIYINFYI